MWIGILIAAILSTLFLQSRRLVFDSFDASGANARGVRRERMSLYFQVLLAVTVSTAAQVVGVLLVVVMLTLPAAVANFWGGTLQKMLVLSVGIAVVGVVFGLGSSWLTGGPPAFFIALIEAMIYFLALIARRGSVL